MLANIPNIISFFRILAAPVFLFLFISDNNTLIIIALFLFLLAAISDWLDGWYARKFNQTSKWGVFIDPLADKVLNSIAFIAFVFEGIIPFWMVLIIIIRDICITFLRLFADSHNMPIKTKYMAKLKTFLQFGLIIYVLSVYFFSTVFDKPDLIMSVYSDHVYWLMFFLTVFTIWTFIDYLIDNDKIVKKLFGYSN